MDFAVGPRAENAVTQNTVTKQRCVEAKSSEQQRQR